MRDRNSKVRNASRTDWRTCHRHPMYAVTAHPSSHDTTMKANTTGTSIAMSGPTVTESIQRV